MRIVRTMAQRILAADYPEKEARQIYKLWFGSEESPNDSFEMAKTWYKVNPDFDKLLFSDYGPLVDEINQETAKKWHKTPQTHIALIILLDQFTRNMFRGTAKMFAYDSLALDASLYVLNNNWEFGDWQTVYGVAEKKFLLMPLMHSEDAKDVAMCSKLVSSVSGLEAVAKFADIHLDIVKKFGRYPHRNELMGRQNTQDEVEYLAKDLPGFARISSKK